MNDTHSVENNRTTNAWSLNAKRVGTSARARNNKRHMKTLDHIRSLLLPVHSKPKSVWSRVGFGRTRAFRGRILTSSSEQEPVFSQKHRRISNFQRRWGACFRCERKTFTSLGTRRRRFSGFQDGQTGQGTDGRTERADRGTSGQRDRTEGQVVHHGSSITSLPAQITGHPSRLREGEEKNLAECVLMSSIPSCASDAIWLPGAARRWMPGSC